MDDPEVGLSFDWHERASVLILKKVFPDSSRVLHPKMVVLLSKWGDLMWVLSFDWPLTLFESAPPPKNSKYKKVNLGRST